MSFRIKECWMVIATDPLTDEEGAPSFQLPNGTHVPLVATDLIRKDQIIEMAQAILRDSIPIPMRLVRFSQMIEEGEIKL